MHCYTCELEGAGAQSLGTACAQRRLLGGRHQDQPRNTKNRAFIVENCS